MAKNLNFADIYQNMEELNTYINRADYSGVRDFFLQRGEKLTLRKKEYFIQQHALSQYAAYIEEGIFHYTCIGDDGKEHIVGYSFENEFICDYISFIKKTNSLVSIRALTKSTLYVITQQDYLEYANTIQNGLHFGWLISNGLLEMCYNRLLTFYCDSPEQRYVKLMKQCPSLKDKVPLKEIASFLGVSPETVSHIRKKLLHE